MIIETERLILRPFRESDAADVLELVFIKQKWHNSSMKKVKKTRKPYPTDLTDAQWREIEPLYSGMRNRKWSKRELTNAVLYITKTGCQWRNLPHDFPPYQTAYSFSAGDKSQDYGRKSSFIWLKRFVLMPEETLNPAML